ncbi:t-SNARE [Imleria badia]|nr:t-SNARE [Imleria badia]
MGRDRLAALRPIELQHIPPPASQPTNGTLNGSYLPPSQDTSSMHAFYAETATIQESIAEFDANITAVADLHARSLNALSEQDSAANHSRLAELTESSRALSNALSNRIKALKIQPGGASPQDAEIRKNRITLVHGKFVETLQRYQTVEQQYRQRYRDRVERQFRIVKPDATADEVSAIVDDTQGGSNAIFLQAITSSTRYGESRQAYREVQERHQDIQRIEVTLAELAQLFNDMATLISQQDEQVASIETKAIGVEEDTRKGVGEVDLAIKHARSARRKRWICFFITIIVILAAVGIGVGVYFSEHPPGKSSSSGG